MRISIDYPLKSLNTFGIPAQANYFAPFSSAQMLGELLDDRRFQNPELILGGGSNILLIHSPRSVLKNEVKGINVIQEEENCVYVEVGAGENWHQFVLYCINQGWAGIENLSLIPGNVGASPMQNIGAYGVEVKDTFYSLEAFHIREKKTVTFYNQDCRFGYRNSIFKNEWKGAFVILSVTYRLSKKPQFHLSYGSIQNELEKMGIKELSIKAVSDAVIRIRTHKLPDPEKIGNAGSFFKNPIVSKETHDALKAEFPQLKSYPFKEKFKLAAAWLIEQCGWKGRREGTAGVHDRQALVLVNTGDADGEDIYRLSKKIQASVLERFDVKLEREVNVV